MPIVNNLDDLRAVVKLCRDESIANLHVDGISITLGPEGLYARAVPPPTPAEKRPDLKDPGNPALEPIRQRMNGEEVDEETLFLSAGGAPGWAPTGGNR